jgi:hypothetical protein
VKNFLCWNPESIGEVINIDADFVPDEIFWAVHINTPIVIRGAEESSSKVTIDTKELMEMFLNPGINHFQLSIIGEVGTGKSHIIQWMRQILEQNDDYVVITVRRLETNLRAILDKLVDRLPKEKQKRYKEELNQAGVMVNDRQAQKESLLNNLQVAIRQDQVKSNSIFPKESEEHFLNTLPDLLLDPQLRLDKFLKDGQIIDQLVNRLFSSRDGKREDERLEFLSEHLPLSGVDIKKASYLAQEALLGLTHDSEINIPCALSIINRNLDAAIALSMNFSGERLVELMNELRQHLKKEGKELILLFEEFARSQGYDGTLLETLLEQGGKKLCNIRWAIACTTGFYLGLLDTARTRMNVVIDMDDVGQLVAKSPQQISSFIGRYLNAVRIGKKQLTKFYQSIDDIVPNFCDSCENQKICHQSFGITKDNFGLYPLTQSAVEIICQRLGDTTKSEEENFFNPRSIQKNLLTPILNNAATTLPVGEFPNKTIHDVLGGIKTIPPMIRNQLDEKYGLSAERYVAFLDLWKGSPNPSGVAPEIFEAFNLRVMDESTPPSDTSKDTPVPKPSPDKPDPKIPSAIVEINNWPGGGILSQSTAQKLRVALFKLIDRAIDWDNLGLNKTIFSGATAGARPFRNQSITIIRQETKGGTTGSNLVQLQLPLEPDNERDFNLTATAFEAIFEAENHGSWSFPNSNEKLIALLSLVERCSTEVRKQITNLQGDTKKWDPVAGAIELIAVTNALGGRLTAKVNAPTILDQCFYLPQKSSAFLDRDLSQIYELLCSEHKNLVSFVRAHKSGTKGGVVGKFLDPQGILEPIEKLLNGKWALNRTPISHNSDLYKKISDLYKKISTNLAKTIENERLLRTEWIKSIELFLGEDLSAEQLIELAESLSLAISNAALPVKSNIELNEKIQSFKSSKFNETFAAMQESLSPQKENTLIHYGHGDINSVSATNDLLTSIEKVIQESEENLAALERSVAKTGGDQIRESEDIIIHSLDSILSDFTKFEDWSDASR